MPVFGFQRGGKCFGKGTFIGKVPISTSEKALAFGIYLAVHFCPTRLNVSDGPTRSVPLWPTHSGPSILDLLDFEGLFRLAELPKTRRWAASWTCLFLGLCALHSLPPAALAIENPCFRSSLPSVDFYQHLLEFDAALGFPGEGPPKGSNGFSGVVVFLAVLLYRGS